MAKNNIPLPIKLLKDPRHALSLGLGSGYAPIAPGTFGTLAAIPFYLLLQYLPLWNYALFILVTFTLGVWLCQITSNALGVHDHSGIVWDEMVGLWITLIAAPAGWQWIALGFVAFRFFDIVKPWPISWLDKKVHGGFGIMIDDVLAGVFAWCVVQVVAYQGWM